LYGNVNELRDVGENPGKSSLFFLTVMKGAIPQHKITLESVRPEIGLEGWESASVLEASGAFSSILENLRESMIFSPARTHNRIRSPR